MQRGAPGARVMSGVACAVSGLLAAGCSVDKAMTALPPQSQKRAPVPSRMQGRSLLPIFDGSATKWRDAFLVEYFSDTVFPRVLNMGYSAVRTDRYKYIQYRDISGMDELYDLQADPYEEHNQIGDPQSAEPPRHNAHAAERTAHRDGRHGTCSGRRTLGQGSSVRERQK